MSNTNREPERVAPVPLPPIPGNPKLLTLEERRKVWLEIGAYFSRGGGRLTPAMVKMADEVGLERYELTLREAEAALAAAQSRAKRLEAALDKAQYVMRFHAMRCELLRSQSGSEEHVAAYKELMMPQALAAAPARPEVRKS